MAVVRQLAALWRRRQLVRTFLVQDLRLKYRRSSLGFLWSLLNPLLMLTVMATAFSVVFGRGTGPGSFSLHLFACLLPWQALAGSIESGSRSLVQGEALLLQYPLPKVLLVFRRVLFAFVEYLFATLALSIVAWFLGFRASWALLWLPVAVLLLFMFALGLATVAAVAMVFFRDIVHLVGVGMRAWFYMTPVLIPFDRIPPDAEVYAKLNPAYHFVRIFDDVINWARPPETATLITAAALAIASLSIGLYVADRNEHRVVFRL